MLNIEMEALHNNIVVPLLTYASEIWMCNEVPSSSIQAFGMSFLRGACDLNSMDGESI